AFSAGASAAIVMRQPAQTPPGMPLVFVEDTLAALDALAAVARRRAQAKIVAVTGSVGKTTVKEMLRLCLSAVGKAYASPGASNDRLGVSLSLANLPADAHYAIFEIGLGGTGDIASLSRLVRPDAAVVTSIEAAHLADFASLEAIADAKAGVFDGLAAGGVVVLDREGPYYSRLCAAAKARGIKSVACFASKGKADAFLRDPILMEQGSIVKACVGGREVSYALSVPGAHIVKDSLIALLTAFAVSGKAEECAAALAHVAPMKGCGLSREIDWGEGCVRLIDESGACNPVSVCAAIQVLGQSMPPGEGRRVLVLGEMPGLGRTSPDLHLALVADIVKAGIDRVFCFGDTVRYLYDALPVSLRGAYSVEAAELSPFVVRALRDGDIVTVKGAGEAATKAALDELLSLSNSSQNIAVNA
ncbi:MAG: Mur ligase family protein, partial [Alphaproteobacteria bacterium]|nr:Mur ligase family protein [Alphaproteobacteria bacterium]